jgi:hypothetical protein
MPQKYEQIRRNAQEAVTVLPRGQRGHSTYSVKHNVPFLFSVTTFVPKMSGDNFNPHVSTGVAPIAYLDAMLAEPFDEFTSSPAGAAVYQLGPFGTAARKIKVWDLTLVP